MKPIYVSEENHKEMKVKSANSGFTINQIADKLIEIWLSNDDDIGVIDSLEDDKNSSIENL